MDFLSTHLATLYIAMSDQGNQSKKIPNFDNVFFLQGVIGIFLFKEEASIRWWLGATLITIGLGFVHTGKKYRVTEATQSNQNTSTNF